MRATTVKILVAEAFVRASQEKQNASFARLAKVFATQGTATIELAAVERNDDQALVLTCNVIGTPSDAQNSFLNECYSEKLDV